MDTQEPLKSEPYKQETDNQKDSYSSDSGPKFDIDDDWDEDSKGWLGKYGSSVILPIIAFMILAGGIYLYANQKQDENSLVFEEGQTDVEEDLEIDEDLIDAESITETETTVEPDETEIIFPDEEVAEEPVIEEIIPETRKESGDIVEKAIKGDGVTHLARRALKDYLSGNSQDLTNEHKVFVEDYLKDKTNSQLLEVGEEVAFSESLIQEAVNESKKLTPKQLDNLKQYSALVKW